MNKILCVLSLIFFILFLYYIFNYNKEDFSFITYGPYIWMKHGFGTSPYAYNWPRGEFTNATFDYQNQNLYNKDF